MEKYEEQYRALWRDLKGTEHPHQKAVGGDFETVGKLEFQLLGLAGLRPEASLVDVGCGSGRLASQLAPWLKGAYLGTDILESLLSHAQELCRRPDWQFVKTDGATIPWLAESADFVCFFSVFTHLSHEETWRYVLEAERVLKPGGKLVCSFLEFKIRSHWWIFSNTFQDRNPEKVLNQFLSRDAFQAFADNAGLKVKGFFDGDQANIPIDGELFWENGLRMTGFGNLGQSACILEKPGAPPAA